MNKLKYYYTMDQLSDVQTKQLFIESLVWGSAGNYVGGNAGMVMNDNEAFDGDVEFTDEQVDALMSNTDCMYAALMVAGAGVPVYWKGVINNLPENCQKAYWINRCERIVASARLNLDITPLDIEHALDDDAYAALLYIDIDTYHKVLMARRNVTAAIKQQNKH